MKIILRETYESLGRTGEIVEVKDGFARNYLVPQGIAYPQNDFYARLFDTEREELLRRDSLARAQAEEMAGKAAGVEVSFTVKIGDRGKMFGAITNSDIAAELLSQGMEIDRRKIALPEPIKTTGEHFVPVKLHGEVGFTVRVEVIPEAPPEDELTDEELAELEARKAMETAGTELAGEDGSMDFEPPQIVELVEAVSGTPEESGKTKTDADSAENAVETSESEPSAEDSESDSDSSDESKQ